VYTNWDSEPDLNITPFVDVMLVLLAILMVTTPTITYEEKIELPEGTKSKRVTKDSSITVRMDRNRVIYFGEEKYNLESFRDTFKTKSNDINLNTTIFIRADKNLFYRDVMSLLKAIKDVGFTKVSLITE
jgi:biopolymer transport protein ExbD